MFRQHKNAELYLRNVVFGVADSLVSTVGLLSGIAVSGSSRSTILLTGIIYAFVEAFSMAVGSFLSEESTEEYEVKAETSPTKPFIGGVVMFVSFVIASFVPIFPYIVFSASPALFFSIAFSIILLFIVGTLSAKISNVHLLKSGAKMALLGGFAILIGVAVGVLVK